jgi:hypothetical protein
VSIDRESEIHLKGTSSQTVQNFSRLFLTFGDTLKPSSKEERAKTPLFSFSSFSLQKQQASGFPEACCFPFLSQFARILGENRPHL